MRFFLCGDVCCVANKRRDLVSEALFYTTSANGQRTTVGREAATQRFVGAFQAGFPKWTVTQLETAHFSYEIRPLDVDSQTVTVTYGSGCLALPEVEWRPERQRWSRRNQRIARRAVEATKSFHNLCNRFQNVSLHSSNFLPVPKIENESTDAVGGDESEVDLEHLLPRLVESEEARSEIEPRGDGRAPASTSSPCDSVKDETPLARRAFFRHEDLVDTGAATRAKDGSALRRRRAASLHVRGKPQPALGSSPPGTPRYDWQAPRASATRDTVSGRRPTIRVDRSTVA